MLEYIFHREIIAYQNILSLGFVEAALFLCLLGYDKYLGGKKSIFKTKRAQHKQLTRDLSNIFEKAPIWLTVSASEGNVLLAGNDAFTEATGYTSEEISGCTFAEAGFFTQDSELQAGLRAIGETGRLRNFSIDYLKKDGEIRNASWSAEQVKIKGKPYTISAIVDTTQYKIAEDALLKTQDSLHNLAEKNQDGVLILDMQGKIIFSNISATRILGRSKEELEGSSFGLPVPTEHSTEIDIIRKEGNPGIGELHETLTVWEGQLAHLVSIRDVTKIRMQERQLRQSQKLEAVGTLAGGIAHDFNNILSIIMGNCELALLELPSDASSRKYLHETLRVSKWGADLVRQILSFSRQREVDKVPVELTPLVKEAINLLCVGLPANIEISHKLEPLPHRVLADSSQIHQIVMNLCNNAAQAIGQEGGTISVGLDEVMVDEALALGSPNHLMGPCQCLSVRDTGCGMSQAVLERIFEPFYTTKEPTKGTGLGLSVVHGIVQSHGGALSVSSQPGEGSTFAVYLPVLVEEIEERNDQDSQ